MLHMTDMWRWSLTWRNPYTTPPGPRVLKTIIVPAGTPCPLEITELWTPYTKSYIRIYHFIYIGQASDRSSTVAIAIWVMIIMMFRGWRRPYTLRFLARILPFMEMRHIVFIVNNVIPVGIIFSLLQTFEII